MKKYIIYGRASCPFCIKIITKLAKAEKCFYAHMLQDGSKELEEMKEKWGHPTVPIVIEVSETQTLLGGCDDTLKLLGLDK
jgi:glutaredoxin